MKTKIKINLTIFIIIFTIIISNLGQMILSNEQFQKENNPIKLK